MNARLQPGSGAGAKDVDGLVWREDAVFAKHVAPFREVLRGDRRDHLVDQELEIRAAPVAVLDGNLMRPHESWR